MPELPAVPHSPGEASSAADQAAQRRDQAALARDDAADARDTGAAAEDSLLQGLSDRQHAARDRAAAASDRAAAAARALAAAARDKAAEAREHATAGASDAQQAQNRAAAAGDRAASADDRQRSASDRDGAADQLQSAYRDGLTGLLMRDAGREQLGQAMDRARRAAEPFVLGFLDVDYLKRFNDGHGHAAGDRLLRAVGDAMTGSVRSYDVLVRYGGDEFLCGLVGTSHEEADDRLRAVAELVRQSGGSVSIGSAALNPFESLDDLIGRADEDMYARRSLVRKDAELRQRG